MQGKNHGESHVKEGALTNGNGFFDYLYSFEAVFNKNKLRGT